MFDNGKEQSFYRETAFGGLERTKFFRDAQLLESKPLGGSKQEKSAERAAMACFGSAIAELLECKKCYVAIIADASGLKLEEIRVGHDLFDPSSGAAAAQMARKEPDSECVLVEPGNPRTQLVRKLIGVESIAGSHSVTGRFPAGNKTTVIFVAGWRETALSSDEVPCLARAIRVMWDTAKSISQPSRRQSELKSWLEQLVFPAFVVDQGLRIHEANSRGRTLLGEGAVLKDIRGTLSGLNSSITESLKQAFHEALVLYGDLGRKNTIVPLSTEHQQFAFARVSALPAQSEVRRALVIVPQFDEVSGATRIASAFNLSWAEERIVARILQGQCPRQIGADLRLTEATVRTYTKRIMLKLGINRQSEFFVLYHLTLSPFGAAQRAGAPCGISHRRNEETH